MTDAERISYAKESDVYEDLRLAGRLSNLKSWGRLLRRRDRRNSQNGHHEPSPDGLHGGHIEARRTPNYLTVSSNSPQV